MELFNFFRRPKCVVTSLEFRGQRIEILRRPYQKTLRLNVHRSGKVRISCRVNTGENEISRFLLENEAWLKGQLARVALSPRKQFLAGEDFPFLGKNFVLEISQESKRRPTLKYSPPILKAMTSEDLSLAGWKKLFRGFYIRQAKKVLPERLEHWSEVMGLKFSAISIRGQRTRWGSCSSAGTISLNWKLMAFSLEIIDYVLIHELAHLIHPNHSRSFWQLVEAHCLNYRERRKSLRLQQNICDFLE